MGYPDQVSRDAFGPTMDVTRIPVVPTRDVGGPQFNLTWWQVAGASLMVPRAWVGLSATGQVLAAAEAWNANQNGNLHPVVVHSATGFYVVAYQPTAPNELGVQRPLALSFVECDVQASTNGPWSANGAFVTATAWAQVTNYGLNAVVTAGGNTYVATAQASTTVAAGSDHAALPQATINVGSTAGFPAAGSAFLPDLNTTVAYTGLGGGGTTLTGCTGGAGTLLTGQTVNATSSNSGTGPSGTGSSITDGGITWAFVAATANAGYVAVVSVSLAGTPIDNAVTVKFR